MQPNYNSLIHQSDSSTKPSGTGRAGAPVPSRDGAAALYEQPKVEHESKKVPASRPLVGHVDQQSGPVNPCPPTVIRGAKLHEAEIGIDWLRFTVPNNFLHQVTNRLAEYLGRYGHKQGGHFGYAERFEFSCGASVNFMNDPDRECCIDLSGEVCKQLGHDSILEIMRWAYIHLGKATRVDIRLDFKGHDLNLIQQVHMACERKELCRCRCWEPRIPKTANGKILGYSVNLGKRGKDGSGRYVRVYDKGLETGDAPMGKWERWETEFSKDAANQVCMRLLESCNWTESAVELALGAVEFREHNGSRSLKRRPVAQWWAKFTEGINPVLVRIKRIPTNLTRHATWLCKCVMPGIHTMAHHSGQTVMQVIDFFVGKQNLAKTVESASPAVWEYLKIRQSICDNKQSDLS